MWFGNGILPGTTEDQQCRRQSVFCFVVLLVLFVVVLFVFVAVVFYFIFFATQVRLQFDCFLSGEARVSFIHHLISNSRAAVRTGSPHKGIRDDSSV